ncbi:MAG: NAD-binding protein [Methylohalobius sp.]|nr:NAD-binding protein [Methylohalobius sp.]
MSCRRRAFSIPYLPGQLARILKRIYIAAALLALMIVMGVVGLRLWATPTPSLSDAFYMTIITITTVGYGEIVPADSFGERLFLGMLAVGGFGTITFLFTSLSVFFLETDLDVTLRRRRMERQIKKLRHHYIICGFGRVGRNVAQELLMTQRSFVAIDVDHAQLESQRERFPDLLYLHGDASEDELLLAADIEDARGVFAVTGDDSRNLMIALTAKQLNPKVRVVARCHEMHNIPKLRKAGADSVISPDFTGGMRIASAMIRPHVVSFLEEMLRSEHRLRLEEVSVPENFVPRRLGDLNLSGRDYLLLAVRHGSDWQFNPPPEFEIRPYQVLVVMATPQGRHQLERLLHG